MSQSQVSEVGWQPARGKDTHPANLHNTHVLRMSPLCSKATKGDKRHSHLFIVRRLWGCHQWGGLRRVVKVTEVMHLKGIIGRGKRDYTTGQWQVVW